MPTKYTIHSKYPYAPIENGAFYFPTDEGCFFIVSFENAGHNFWQSDMLLEYDKVLSFGFVRRCDDGYHNLDDSACNTIFDIISSTVKSNGILPIYYHHWVEGIDYNDHFYNNFNDEIEFLLPAFELIEFPWTDETGVHRILSVLIHKQNPDRELIVDEFMKTIEVQES